MYKKVVFDSDGLIKLVRASLPNKAFNSFKAYISEQVYTESVVQGKKGLHDEAFEIESLIKDRKINKEKAQISPKALEILENYNLGKGEESSVHLFFNINANAIVSDDKKFLNFLFDNKLPFTMPADLVVSLQKKNVIDKNSALEVLEGLRPFIKESYYLEAKNRVKVRK